MRTPEMYINAIFDIDCESDMGYIYRPTEIAAMKRVTRDYKSKSLRQNIEDPAQSVKAARNNVETIKAMLDKDGCLLIIQRHGLAKVKSPKLICVELQNRGYYWVMESAIRMAQLCLSQE